MDFEHSLDPVIASQAYLGENFGEDNPYEEYP